jgi:hypothetical protein
MDIIVVDSYMEERHGVWFVCIELMYCDGSDRCWMTYRKFDDELRASECLKAIRDAIEEGSVFERGLVSVRRAA